MKTTRCAYWFAAVTFLFVSWPVLAGWTEPILHQELNDPGLNETARSPCLSSDGLTMYFHRDNSSDQEQIVEAYRDVPYGPFTSERIALELYSHNRSVHDPWVTEDGLRMYLGRYDGGTTRIVIRMAKRDNTGQTWNYSRKFGEIHVNGKNDYSMTLTEDELTIYFQSNRSGTYYIYKASRPSTGHQFTNATFASELNDGENSGGPCLMPDGLTIYFNALRDGNSTTDIYRATRSAMSEPFGDIQRVWPSTDLYQEGSPYVTPDQKSIYFASSRDPEGHGIWFTHLENEVAVDIKPGSCPNKVNVKSKGVLPVAILGTEEFDVSSIEVSSIRLAGVAPIRNSYEDVSEPLADPNECECTTNGPDGFGDLTLKFGTQSVLEALGEVNTGDILTLSLTGVLNDETSIEGSDCIVIVGRRKPINDADINKDGVVNTIDIAIVAENWLQSSIVEE